MNAKPLFKISILSIALAAATGATAQTQPPTQGDMRTAVLEARARGELVPAGQAVEPFAARSGADTFARSRDDVRREVLQARADGALIPAGQGAVFERSLPISLLARAEVKESVRVARERGELIPAGEGIGPVEWHARGYAARGATFAAHRPR